MGRHSALAPVDAAPKAEAGLIDRATGPTPVVQTSTPVTDPRLFDGSISWTRAAGVEDSATRDPGVLTPEPLLRHPVATNTAAPRPASVRPEMPAPPRSAHAVAAGQPRSAEAGAVGAPRYLAASLTTRPQPVIPSPAPEAAPFAAGRSAKVAACAVAVLGAVSTAALLLPGQTSTATADALSAPTTSPTQLPTGAARGAAIAALVHRPSRSASHHGLAIGKASHRPSRGGRGRASAPAASSTSTASASVAASVPASSSSSSSTTTPLATASRDAVATTGTDLRSIIGAAANGSLLGLNAGNFVMRDFDSNLMGANLRQSGIRGAGVDKTVIEMVPHTSTKAGHVPTANYTTNQLYLLSTIGGTPGLSGFTLKATDQGHLYNGLRIGQTTNARVSDVKVEGVPGNKSFPPGETFVLNDWRTDGSVYDRITIDGAGVAAAGFGANSSTNITINNSRFTGAAYSSGAAFWQTRNITMNNVMAVDNRSGMNFERDTGTITLNRPTFRNNRLYDMQFGSDQGGANVIINDPVLAPGQKIRMNVPLQYHGVSNGQKRSNIHVYVNGVDRTSQLVQFL
jgi:hypothetical protein